MVIIQTPGICATCNKKLVLCDIKNEANGKRDTFVCDNGHLNFNKFKNYE